MFSEWNKIAIIKTIVLAIISIPVLFVPTFPNPKMPWFLPLIVLIVVTLGLKFRSRKTPIENLVKPSWNDNPFSFTYPLRGYQFGAFFFISQGGAMLLSSLIHSEQSFNTFSLLAISYGIGLLIGIEWILRGAKK